MTGSSGLHSHKKKKFRMFKGVSHLTPYHPHLLWKASHLTRGSGRFTHCPAGFCGLSAAYNYTLPRSIPAVDLSHIWQFHFTCSPNKGEVPAAKRKRSMGQQQKGTFISLAILLSVSVYFCLYVRLYVYRTTHNNLCLQNIFYFYVCIFVHVYITVS